MQSIADYPYMVVLVRGVGNFQNPPIADHWIPNLHGSLSQEGECSFSEVLLMQPNAAHPYMKILGRGAHSSKFLPLQPIAAHSYIVILVGGWVFPQNSPIADHWSPNLHGSLSQGRGSTSCAVHCSPLIHGSFRQGRYFLKIPPIAAKCSALLHGNFCQGFEYFLRLLLLEPKLTWQS